MNDGSVITWGASDSGGDSSAVASQLSSGVIEIYSILSNDDNDGAFAALKDDGSVVTWGSASTGGAEDSSSVSAQLSSGVTKIYGTFGQEGGAFAALKSDGSVITWGNNASGGDSSSVSSQLSSNYKLQDSQQFVITVSVGDGQGSRPIQKGALQPLTLAKVKNDPFSFSYNTEKGKTYKVECSPDLIRWYEVDLVTGTGSEVNFTDKRRRLFGQQFYRVQAKE